MYDVVTLSLFDSFWNKANPKKFYVLQIKYVQFQWMSIFVFSFLLSTYFSFVIGENGNFGIKIFFWIWIIRKHDFRNILFSLIFSIFVSLEKKYFHFAKMVMTSFYIFKFWKGESFLKWKLFNIKLYFLFLFFL